LICTCSSKSMENRYGNGKREPCRQSTAELGQRRGLMPQFGPSSISPAKQNSLQDTCRTRQTHFFVLSRGARKTELKLTVHATAKTSRQGNPYSNRADDLRGCVELNGLGPPSKVFSVLSVHGMRIVSEQLSLGSMTAHFLGRIRS